MQKLSVLSQLPWLYYRGMKLVPTIFMSTPCNISPNYRYIYGTCMLMDLSKLSQDFKMFTMIFLTFSQKLSLFNEYSWHLAQNSVLNSQFVWVIFKNTKPRFWWGNKICSNFFHILACPARSRQLKMNITKFTPSTFSIFSSKTAHIVNMVLSPSKEVLISKPDSTKAKNFIKLTEKTTW